ncbi:MULTISPECIES: DMT family transporter [unclassified Streptomyces]|uniref:DMT family transporter n=1 Tax=unclassified Streptomyces TaxID=2593676 RepID=UPI0027404A41|nr:MULTISPECIES: DMT family transporter [unclassified Streptomyces]
MVTILLSIVFALLAAGSNAVGTVLQRRAVVAVPASRSLRIGLIRDLLRTPIWFGGILGVIFSAVFQALALATGPLAVVQPIFILELPLALVVGGVAFHVAVTRKAWSSVACIVGGLALALFSLAPRGGREQVPGLWWLPALAITGGIGAALVLAGLRRPVGLMRAASLAAGAAIGNAVTAALVKSAMDILSTRGAVAFFLAWQTYSFAAVGAFSLFLLGIAMQGGPLIGSQPALTLGDAAVSFGLGVTIYAERPRAGFWLVPALLGLAVLFYGVLALSRTKCLAQCIDPDEDELDVIGQPAATPG